MSNTKEFTEGQSKDILNAAQSGDTFTDELAAVPFYQIFSGPMTACIDAQASASYNTIEFIKQIGFEGNGENEDMFGKPIYIEFEYEKPSALMGLLTSKTKVKVPFLTMMPIPHLRLNSLIVELNIKLESSRTSELTSGKIKNNMETTDKETTGTETTTSADQSNTGWWETNQDVKKWKKTEKSLGTIQTTQTSSAGQTINREYSLKVRMEALNDTLPGGLERIIDILAGSIQEVGEATGAV